LAEAAAAHEAAVDQLVHSYNDHIDSLRSELCADSVQRANSDARCAELKAQHAAAQEAAQAATREALAKLDLTRAQVSQLQQAAESMRKQLASAAAAGQRQQEAAADSAAGLQRELTAARQQLADARVEFIRLQDAADAAKRDAAHARADAIAAQRSLHDYQAAAKEEAARLAGQLSESRAGQERTSREVAALQERLLQAQKYLEELAGDDGYSCHVSPTNAAYKSATASPSSSPLRGAQRTATRLNHSAERAKADQLAQREAHIAALLEENDELLQRVRQLGLATWPPTQHQVAQHVADSATAAQAVADAEIVDLRQQLSAQLAEVAMMRSQIAALERRLIDAHSAAKAAEHELESTHQALKRAEAEIADQRAAACHLEEQLAAAKAQLQEAQESMACTESREAHSDSDAAVELLRRELGFLQQQFEAVVEEATQKDEELTAAKAAAAAAATAYSAPLDAARTDAGGVAQEGVAVAEALRNELDGLRKHDEAAR